MTDDAATIKATTDSRPFQVDIPRKLDECATA